MLYRILSGLALCALAAGASAQPVISGVIDGDLPMGLPKAIEVFFPDASADISNCGLGSANNGNGSDGQELTFDAVSVAANSFYYVASEATGFQSYFGFAADETDGAANINGDDAIELFCNNVVVDVFGDINVDGSGQAWEYADGYAYRNNGVGANNGVFSSGDFSYSGAGGIDSCTTNNTCGRQFPIGSFTGGGPDVTPPTIDSVLRPIAGPTDATELTFRAAFSEAVTGFDMADVTVNTTQTAAFSSFAIASTMNAAHYDIVVSGIAGMGDISVTVDATGVQDLALNLGTGTDTSEPVAVDPNAPDYYDSVDASNAQTLRTTLHDLIDDHTRFDYSGGGTSAWTILELADENPDNANQVLTVYENSVYTKVTDRNAGSGSDNYNREHTWPRSVGLGSTSDANNSLAVDTHNLRIANTAYNSDRGSRAFDACPGCTERVTESNAGVGGANSGQYPGDSNWQSAADGGGGSWEVWSDRRGDIARTMFYMDVRYEGDLNAVTGQTETDLVLTDDRGLTNTVSGNTAYMGMLSTLIAWHQADPVDAKEQDRNDVVFSFQGNRNPFVDHPEWVDVLFGDLCTLVVDTPSAGATFPSGSTITFGLDSSDACYDAGTLSWSSDLDGQIGTGVTFMAMLSDGLHTISVAGQDLDMNPIGTQFTVQVGAPNNLLEIFEIQGDGYNSPVAGQMIITENNIVTAVLGNGFVMQTPDERADGNPNTSDGIIVFTGSAPAVMIGDNVNVSGEVVEFFGLTEFTGNPTVNVNSSGNTLPTPITFDANLPSADPNNPSCTVSGGIPANGENTNFECFEGMLVQVDDGVIATGNQGFGSDPVAEVWANVGDVRAKREPGIEFPGLPGLPVFDGNPEMFELDLDRAGLPNLTLSGGSRFSTTGVIGFDFGDYEVWPISESLFSLTSIAPLPKPVRAADIDEFTVASLNMFRFFDDQEDGDVNTDDAVVPTLEYQQRLAYFSEYIRNVLLVPDVLAVQEVDGLPALQDLVNQIETDDPSLDLIAVLQDGQDIGGIDIGFIVNAQTVSNVTAMQLGVSEELEPNDPLHDRPPLLLNATITVDSVGVAVKVLGVHNRSFSGIEGSDATRVRNKRLQQALSIATMVQTEQTTDPNVPLIVIGDFNDFEFSDGYVDAIGHIKGNFDPNDAELSGDDRVSPDLVNVIDLIPDAERYSFVFRRNAQTLDHALLSSAARDFYTGAEFARAHADAAEVMMDESSDHDGLVVYFRNVEELIFANGFETVTSVTE